LGSVVYLGRGQRREHAAATARDAESLLRPGYNCWNVAQANRVALLVDAKDYFAAFHRAALNAQRSIVAVADPEEPIALQAARRPRLRPPAGESAGLDAPPSHSSCRLQSVTPCYSRLARSGL